MRISDSTAAWTDGLSYIKFDEKLLKNETLKNEMSCNTLFD